jgi:hypothetical protein
VIFAEIQLKDVCAYVHIVAKETPVNAVFLMQLQVAVNDKSSNNSKLIFWSRYGYFSKAIKAGK